MLQTPAGDCIEAEAAHGAPRPLFSFGFPVFFVSEAADVTCAPTARSIMFMCRGHWAAQSSLNALILEAATHPLPGALHAPLCQRGQGSDAPRSSSRSSAVAEPSEHPKHPAWRDCCLAPRDCEGTDGVADPPGGRRHGDEALAAAPEGEPHVHQPGGLHLRLDSRPGLPGKARRRAPQPLLQCPHAAAGDSGSAAPRAAGWERLCR